MHLQDLVRAMLLTLGLVTLTAGCRRTPPAAMQPPPPTVTVASPTQREFTDEVELSARVEPMETVEIRSRVSGYLTEVGFKSGQRVEKGDLLFVIDPRPFRAALQRAEADLAQARARLEGSERDDQRAVALAEQKAISKEESDQRRTRLAEARAAVASAEALVTTAGLNLEYTQIKSPIRGRVSRALVTAGNNVSGVDGFTTLLTTVVTDDPVYVYADLDDATVLRLQSLKASGKMAVNASGKLPVRLTIPDAPALDRDGFVESFNNRVEAETGSLLLRAQVGNSDGLLIPGLFARLRLPVSGKSQVVMVPETAIGTDQAQRFVLLLSPSNTVDYRTIKLGPAIDGQRVVREGLTGTEKVIVNGIARVRPGMPVSPVSATNSPIASANGH